MNEKYKNDISLSKKKISDALNKIDLQRLDNILFALEEYNDSSEGPLIEIEEKVKASKKELEKIKQNLSDCLSELSNQQTSIEDMEKELYKLFL